MKKKTIAICIVVVVVIAVLASVWLLFNPKALGSMSHSYTESTTSSSNFSFSGEIGERIKISFASDIKSGDLNIVLYDSNKNIVYQLDKAKELVTYYTFSSTDTYMLTAEYTNFVGNFKVKVYSIK